MKANVLPIFRDHIGTLTDARTKRPKVADYALFYGVPLALVVVGWLLRWKVEGFEAVLVALALITGLLFNLLVLLFDSAARAKSRPGSTSDLVLIKHLQANVTYAVSVALLATTWVGALALTGIDKIGRPWSALLVARLAHFVLTLAMILKRVRSAFLREIT